MTAQIVKLSSKQQNINQAIDQISHKLRNSESDITVIFKPKTKQTSKQTNKQKNQHIISKFSQEISQEQDYENGLDDFQQFYFPSKHQHQHQNFDNKNKNSFAVSQKYLSNHSIKQIDEKFNIFVSTKQILPNIVLTAKQKSKQSKSKKSFDFIEQQEKCLNKNDNIFMIEQNNQQSSKVYNRNITTSKKQQNIHKIPPLLKLSEKNSRKQVPTRQHQRQATKALSAESQSKYSQEKQSIIQSLFVVQNKLNDAINFIRNNKIFQLQQYLYEFKAKYNYMADRVQIKWRLLMAYCKQNRKQFERASILYKQVLQMSELSPKSLLIDSADIYHRLGICLKQINKWNQGILAFSKALNLYKQNQNRTKYSQCMNNIGTLYLAAYQIQQAEQCFLISYQLKKCEQPNNGKKLISTLLNLYQCNIIMHNFDQAIKIMKQAQSISLTLNQNIILKAGIHRRAGKVYFMKGNLIQANKRYLLGLDLLCHKYSCCLQFGQLCNNLALVKLQQKQYTQAKKLLDTALTCLNFYFSKDSFRIKNIKMNRQLVDKVSSQES